MISEGGTSNPIVYEMRITASELDVILLALEHETSEGNDYYNNIKDKLLKEYKCLSEIRNIRALRKYGYMDESRLNWK